MWFSKYAVELALFCHWEVVQWVADELLLIWTLDTRVCKISIKYEKLKMVLVYQAQYKVKPTRWKNASLRTTINHLRWILLNAAKKSLKKSYFPAPHLTSRILHSHPDWHRWTPATKMLILFIIQVGIAVSYLKYNRTHLNGSLVVRWTNNLIPDHYIVTGTR